MNTLSQDRWLTLMTSFSLPKGLETFKALQAAYGETHRAYHTAEHITACLSHLDTNAHLAENKDNIECALWFHDAVYKPFSGTNEEDSAAWADKFLKDGRIDDARRGRIHTLIMITKSHDAAKTPDEKLMLDIDLSILGTLEHIYDQFEKDVRREYKKVPRFMFRKKRKEILQKFVAQDRIYKTDIFFASHEEQARHNLNRTIAKL